MRSSHHRPSHGRTQWRVKAIEDALAENGGNRTRTAKQLGISLRTLQYRLKEYQLGGE